jgi:hypothetical protein
VGCCYAGVWEGGGVGERMGHGSAGGTTLCEARDAFTMLQYASFRAGLRWAVPFPARLHCAVPFCVLRCGAVCAVLCCKRAACTDLGLAVLVGMPCTHATLRRAVLYICAVAL